MNYEMQDRVAVVTGGTSGIGLATVKLLLQEGASVALCGRDAAKLDKIVRELAEAHGAGRVFGMICDVTRKEAVAAFKAGVEKKFGRTDFLVNNAGKGRTSTIADTTDEAWREELDLKFFSVLHPTKAFLPLLAQSPCASVVCVNALLARRPEPHMAATSAARAGVLNLVKSMSGEFAPQGIRVNSILIGLVESEQWERRFRAAKAENPAVTREAWFGKLAHDREIPLGRFGQPTEAAQVILFLAAPVSSYLTGVAIDVAGGQSRYV
jgi:NAD(P)-dependent dehydrogenase (short-subunit alcohol dehydrogenase family)